MSLSDTRELYTERLIALKKDLETTGERLKAKKLRAHQEDKIKSFISSLCASYIERLDVTLSVLSLLEQEIADADVEVSRTTTAYLIHQIDQLLYLEAESELYYFLAPFLSYAKNKLGFEDDVLLCVVRHPVLSVTPFAIESDSSEKQHLRMIRCPSAILNAPILWPVLLHELAHVLEDFFLNLVGPVPLAKPSDGIPKEVYVPSYKLEYLCDYVAAKLVGAVFVKILREFYFAETRVIFPTHPTWYLRTKHLTELLKSIPFYQDTLKESLDKFVEDYKEKEGTAGPDVPSDELRTVYDEVDRRISRDKNDETEMPKAVSKLQKFDPFIGPATTLMNAAYEILRSDSFDKTIKDHFQGDKERLRSEFSYLVTDCLRLCWISSLARPLLQTVEPQQNT